MTNHHLSYNHQYDYQYEYAMNWIWLP